MKYLTHVPNIILGAAADNDGDYDDDDDDDDNGDDDDYYYYSQDYECWVYLANPDLASPDKSALIYDLTTFRSNEEG